MMSTYRHKRSPHYHYDFVFRGQRFHGSTGCTTKRAADEYERRVRHQAALPDPRRPPITLDEAAGLYDDHARHLPSYPTMRYMIAALLAGLGKARPLSDIGQRDLQVYFARRRAGRANSSVNREIALARAIWRRAGAARFDIGEMPDWGNLSLPQPRAVPRELAQDEEARLFEALADDAFDAVRFALISGWRRAEVIGLRWADANLANATAVTRIKGGDVVSRALNGALVAIIASQPKVGPFVFTYACRQSRGQRRKGERYPMTATVLRQRFDEARAAAELAGFRFHDLRHTAATRILRATSNLALVKEALKHRTISTTLRYAHVLSEDVRDGLDAAMSRNSPELVGPAKRKA